MCTWGCAVARFAAGAVCTCECCAVAVNMAAVTFMGCTGSVIAVCSYGALLGCMGHAVAARVTFGCAGGAILVCTYGAVSKYLCGVIIGGKTSWWLHGGCGFCAVWNALGTS